MENGAPHSEGHIVENSSQLEEKISRIATNAIVRYYIIIIVIAFPIKQALLDSSYYRDIALYIGDAAISARHLKITNGKNETEESSC